VSPDTSAPQVVSFAGAPVEHDRDLRDFEQVVGGVRWAVVEYAPGAGRSEWCDAPHIGYVVSGRLLYEFADGSEPLRVTAEQGFRLPTTPAHRGRNDGSEPARLFIIDALPAPT
jgi:hypothetical protein